MKILYHIGESCGAETLVERASLVEDAVCPYNQTANEKIALNCLSAVEFFKLNGLGTMVKIRNADSTIYLTVPRIFFNIGTGFAIINYFATKRTKTMLETAMNNQAR